MPETPHLERHFTASDSVRDVVIGVSDGLKVPFALAAGSIAMVHRGGTAQEHPADGRRGGICRNGRLWPGPADQLDERVSEGSVVGSQRAADSEPCCPGVMSVPVSRRSGDRCA